MTIDVPNDQQPNEDVQRSGRSPLVTCLLVVVAALFIYVSTYAALRATGIMSGRRGLGPTRASLKSSKSDFDPFESSSHFLPDLLAKLYGPLIQIELSFRN